MKNKRRHNRKQVLLIYKFRFINVTSFMITTNRGQLSMFQGHLSGTDHQLRHQLLRGFRHLCLARLHGPPERRRCWRGRGWRFV